MGTARIIVTAQLEENKAWYEGGEAWVPKFGPKIEFQLPSDDILYMCKEDVAKICEEVCKNQSSDYERFNYISHHVELIPTIKVNVEYNYATSTVESIGEEICVEK